MPLISLYIGNVPRNKYDRDNRRIISLFPSFEMKNKCRNIKWTIKQTKTYTREVGAIAGGAKARKTDEDIKKSHGVGGAPKQFHSN